MTCLMNYREGELSELQSPLLESRARLERQQITALHERCVLASEGGGRGPTGGCMKGALLGSSPGHVHTASSHGAARAVSVFVLHARAARNSELDCMAVWLHAPLHNACTAAA